MTADTPRWSLAWLPAVVLMLFACASPLAPVADLATHEATARPAATQVEVPTSAPPTSQADIIFHNGVVLTMDDAQPTASAIHIQGEKIVSVGGEVEVLAEAGAATTIVDLGGRTLMPGFVDAHSHYFGRKDFFPTADQAQDAALAQGITTTAEFYVDEAMLTELQALEASAELRLRLSTYLSWNDGCGEPLGDWYLDHPAVRTPGEKLWINGVKVFTDGGSCNVPAVSFEYPGGYGHGDPYFSLTELESLIRELDGAGYQLAIHAIGDRALDVVLQAFTNVLHGVNPLHHRIEHNAVLRPDQLPLYTQAGAVATLLAPFQTCATIGDPSRFRYLVPESHQTWEWPWRDLLDANPNAHFAWHADMPIFTTDVFQHLYGFVTRNQVAEDGTICQAPDWLARNVLTVDEALHLMTTGAAYALQREAELGSLAAGKLADLIVLSENPRAIASAELRDLKVLMTMVGGSFEYCADGMEALCPSTPAAIPTAEATSAAFRDDFDGALDPTWTWFQNDAPGWSLTDVPGWLRLRFSSGSFFNPPPPSNVLLQPAPTGDFDARTYLRASPTQNFQFAGLVVVFDDSSVLQFGHGMCQAPSPCVGDGYYFDNIQYGAPIGGNFARPRSSGSEDQLRLVRDGNTYTAYYLVDGTTWTEVGSHTVDRQPVSVGMIAAQSPSIEASAEFDYFEMITP